MMFSCDGNSVSIVIMVYTHKQACYFVGYLTLLPNMANGQSPGWGIVLALIVAATLVFSSLQRGAKNSTKLYDIKQCVNSALTLEHAQNCVD